MAYRSVDLNVKVLLATSGLLSLSMGVGYPFLSEYVYAVTGSVLLAGAVASMRSVVCVLSLFMGGYLADLAGRKRLIWAGTLLLGLSQILYSSANTPHGFYLAAVCEGVAYFYFPAFNAMIMDSTRGSRIRVFTLFLIAEHLPYTVSPVLGGYLRDLHGVWGLRLSFNVGGIAILALTAARWMWLSETLQETQAVERGAFLTGWVKSVYSFRHLHPFVKRLVWLRSFLLLNGLSMFNYFAVLYAVRYAGVVSFSEWGLVMALSSASYLAAIPLSKLAEKAKPTPLYSALVFLEATTPLMFLLHAKASLFTSMALLNVCGALTYAIERSLVAHFTGHAMRGKAEGFMSVSYYLGAAIGSLIGGLLYSKNPPLILFSASTLLASGAGLSLIYLRKLPRL